MKKTEQSSNASSKDAVASNTTTKTNPTQNESPNDSKPNKTSNGQKGKNNGSTERKTNLPTVEHPNPADKADNRSSERPKNAQGKPAQNGSQEKKPQQKQKENKSVKDQPPKAANQNQGINLRVARDMLSPRETSLVAKLDSVDMSSNPIDYMVINHNLYYVAINSWLHIVQDVSKDERVTLVFSDYIKQHGLRKAISHCQLIADYIIDSYNTDSSKRGTPPNVATSPLYAVLCLVEIDDAGILQILRYLKRFSPSCADLLEDLALDKFYDVNRRCGHVRSKFSLVNQKWCASEDICEFIERRVKHHISFMTSGFVNYYKEDRISFSTGNSTCGKLLKDKLQGYANMQPYWFDLQYPLKPNKNAFYDVRSNAVDHILPAGERVKPNLWERYVLTPKAVPKNYKSARIIASEHPYHSAHMQAVRRALVMSLSKTSYSSMFDPRDQRENEEACRLGSIEAGYVTKDLSSASDRISLNLAMRVFPKYIINTILKHRATHLLRKTAKGDVIVKSKLFLTSGNPATFVCLGILITAVYCTAYEIHQLFCPDDRLLPIFVFGDDGCIDARVSELADEIFERLGFVINTDKSYSLESTYRESCGSEYTQGYDLRTVYFPRKNVWLNEPDPTSKRSVQLQESDKIKGISSLVSLQRATFQRYWSTQRFIADVIRALTPQHVWTTSVPGACATDLLSEIGTAKSRFKTIDRTNWCGGNQPLVVSRKRFEVDRRRDPLLRLQEYNELHPYDQIAYSLSDDCKTITILNCTVHSAISGSAKNVAERDPNVDMFLYVDWLKNGPRYEEPLLRLLRCSSAPRDYAAALEELPLRLRYAEDK